MFNKIAHPAMFLFVCVFRCYFFRLTIIVSHVFITVSLCDVRLSHLNKDYLLTYLLRFPSPNLAATA